jgi:hypothetical protein
MSNNSHKDPIVQQVIDKLSSRSDVGIEKYGTTLDSNNIDDFLTHAMEEAMDLTLYLAKIKSILSSHGYKNLQEALNHLK